MGKYLKMGNKKYRLLKNLKYKKSNNEVTFQDFTIDFSKGTILDLPLKYQECKIYKKNDELEFTGFVNTFKFADMKLDASIEGREMTLNVLSPLKMATIRTVTIIGTMTKKQAIQRILEPLINDGFTIKEMNVPEGQITLNFIAQTVEYCMNNVGFKINVFWNINEKKEIFVNSIDYLFAKLPVKTITELDGRNEGLFHLQPTINNVDYANVINFKNVRMIYTTAVDITEYPNLEVNKTIKNGDSITFLHPIILDENYLRNFMAEQYYKENNYIDFELVTVCNDGTIKVFQSNINYYDSSKSDYNKYTNSGNFTFNDDGGNEGQIVLQRDQFYKNLITGFKWNVGQNAEILAIRSDTSLRYTTMRYFHSDEIKKSKGIISDSGQVEKNIDYKNKWTSLPQLIEYARSSIVQNSNVINQVVAKYTKNPKVEIGDIVEIDKPSFFITGRFAVKDITYTYKNDEDEEWNITLKSSDLISSYIDLFRPAEQQESSTNSEGLVLSEFIEEGFEEKHDIVNFEPPEDKAIRLAKEAWDNEIGSGSDYYVFSIQGYGQTDDDYIVAVRDPETSRNVMFVYVNVVTEECEVEFV